MTPNQSHFESVEEELKFMADASDSDGDIEQSLMYMRYLGRIRQLSAENAELKAKAAVPDGWKLVKVGVEGVRFGNAWHSHEKITGYSADQLNAGHCGIAGRAYMEWLAAAPAQQQSDAVPAEAVEVVATVTVSFDEGDEGSAIELCELHTLLDEGVTDLMTVAQHKRILAAQTASAKGGEE